MTSSLVRRETFISVSIYAIYLLIGVLSTYIASLTSIVMAIIVVVIEYIRLIGLLTKVYKVVAIIFIVNVGLVAYNGYKNELRLSKSAELTEAKSELAGKYLSKSWVKASTFERLLGQMQSVDELPVDYRVLTLLYIALEIALLILVYELGRRVSITSSVKTTYDAYQELKKSLDISSHSEFVRLIKRAKVFDKTWQNSLRVKQNIENTGARPSIAYELTDEEYEKLLSHYQSTEKTDKHKKLGEKNG